MNVPAFWYILLCPAERQFLSDADDDKADASSLGRNSDRMGPIIAEIASKDLLYRT